MSSFLPWFPYTTKSDDCRRLFCFPYAGAGASVFRSWTTRTIGGYEVHPVQLPGRERRAAEAAVDDLPQLIDALLTAIDPLLDAPFALFGHSNGALIAFELARALRRTGRPCPEHLFASGRVAPQVDVGRFSRHELPDDAFLALLQRFNGTPQEILRDPDMMEFLRPMLRADFALNDRYRYAVEAPLSCPITSYGGIDDDLVEPAGLAAWRAQTSDAFELHMLQGGHFFLNDVRDRLIAHIDRRLSAEGPVFA